MEASTSQARTRWELENNVQHSDDALLRFDQAEQTAIQQQEPWKKDPRHFTKCAALTCRTMPGRRSLLSVVQVMP